ncbi:MAG: hypothetical protein U0Q07_19500 [Acidimicrobiales bacterium]
MPSPLILRARARRRPAAAPAATSPAVGAPPPIGARRRRRLALLLVAVVAAAGLRAAADEPLAVAGAEVRHGAGFEATVLGWTSWYGSYQLGDLGAGWCIDHGLRAPDPALAYAPTPVADASADTRAAMAWAATMHSAADPVEAAAVMLVLHDLMGARYPFGTLQVDRMSAANLGGFGGREAVVLARARAIRAEAVAHRHLRAPFRLDLAVDLDPPPARTGRLIGRLTDAAGAVVVGAPMTAKADGAALSADATTTGTDGRAVLGLRAGAGPAWFVAMAGVPDPALSAFASTRAVAQRVARPAFLPVSAAAELAPVPPTTTTTSQPTTTTTAPPTTTTSQPTTTTTAPPTTTTSRPTTTSIAPPTTTTTAAPPATAPPTTTPTTSAPSTTTSSTSVTPTTPTTTAPPTTTSTPATQLPPDSPAGPPPTAVAGPAPVLPRTGGAVGGLVAVGGGLVLVGLAALAASRRPGRRPGRPAGRPTGRSRPGGILGATPRRPPTRSASARPGSGDAIAR